MSERWRIALIDSGADGDAGRTPGIALRFLDTGAGVAAVPPAADSLGHGTRIAAIIASARPAPELLVAQVFDAQRTTTAAAVAAAIHWAVAGRASLVHMSLGLREDRAVLADAIAAASGRGCLLVAATPARGPRVYPAAYPGVLRASGDARCARDELSALDAAAAHFGACPRLADQPAAGGASIAAAHLTRLVAARLRPGTPFGEARAQLAAGARFVGPERRSGAAVGSAPAHRP